MPLLHTRHLALVAATSTNVFLVALASCADETTEPVPGIGGAIGTAGSGGASGGASTAGGTGPGGGTTGGGGGAGPIDPDLPVLGECDPTAIAGPVFVVDPSHPGASDVGDGSPDAPWATLEHAVAQLHAGDTLLVGAGTYSDAEATSSRGFNPAESGTAEAPITLRSCPHLGAVLQAPTTMSVALGIFQREHVVVDGFRVEGMLKAHESSFVTLANCEVVRGSTEGNDPSLNWGIAIHSSDDCVVSNNRVHSLADSGNQQHNTACVMVGFGAYRNRVEFNEADAGGGTVFSAFGQKGGDIADNVWRRNVARRATAGFLGMGSTDGTRYAEDNEFVENVVLDCQAAFLLDHNSRRFAIHSNTAVRVGTFLDGGYLPDGEVGNTDNEVWNNVVHGSTEGYHRGPNEVDWSELLLRSNHNLWNADRLASWAWGSATHDTLEAWQGATGFDGDSLDADAALVDADQDDVHLSAASPARGAADDGRDMGAYPTGQEHVGPTWP